MTNSLRLSIVCLISWISLAGCSSTSPHLIPDTGPDTLTVYRNHIAESGSQPWMVRPIHADQRDLAGYTRDSANEIQQLFPRLPNPELVLYVFPHLTPKGRPVPGYTTSFLMYEKDEYALPGEIAP
jgi:conjugative transfer region lipoprotein (TIGR03751 family)